MDDAARRARFGRAVRAARQELAMNQTEFAANVGLSQTIVSRWELGQVEPEPMQVFGLEMALGLPPGNLSRYLGYMPVDPRDAPEPRARIETGPASLTGLAPPLAVSGMEEFASSLRAVELKLGEQFASLQAMANEIAEAMKPLVAAAQTIRISTLVHAPSVQISQAARDELQQQTALGRDAQRSIDNMQAIAADARRSTENMRAIAGKPKRKPKVNQPEDADGDA